jgi:PncC family amidohydrolase
MTPRIPQAPTFNEIAEMVQEGEAVLKKEAGLTAQALLKARESLVLTESCTAGLVASSLARTPGVSEVFAGAFVVYQAASKHQWLGISRDALRRAPDAVSDEIAGSLALGALERTPHAKISAAITGRLGPSSSTLEREKDGHAWIAIARRVGKGTDGLLQEIQLAPGLTQTGKMPRKAVENLRRARQIAAAIQILRMVRSMLKGTSRSKRQKSN